MKLLKGVTWNHTRGFLPVVASSQRFEELHPDVRIEWDKRSLQAFADEPIEHLMEKYDLLIIDHPWAGFAAKHQALIDLSQYLSEEFLADQLSNSVGGSHQSYNFNGYQSALAIDAATPVSSWRPDLVADIPRTWEDMLILAKEGKVIIPAIPIDSLMNFYMMCIAHGETPFLTKEYVVSKTIGEKALFSLKELANLCTRSIFEWNPIQVYEALSSTNKYAYCPFAYGYANYSTKGYAKNLLSFGDIPTFAGTPLRSTLGGTGLAISSKSKNLEEALDYVKFASSAQSQKCFSGMIGGQPGHRTAWEDKEVNSLTNAYFKNTMPCLDRSYIRPRYNGYLEFQDKAGDPIQSFMKGNRKTTEVLDEIDQLYRHSLPTESVK